MILLGIKTAQNRYLLTLRLKVGTAYILGSLAILLVNLILQEHICLMKSVK